MEVLITVLRGALFVTSAITILMYSDLTWSCVANWLRVRPVSLAEQLSLGIWLGAMGGMSITARRLAELVLLRGVVQPPVNKWDGIELSFGLSLMALGYFFHGYAKAGTRGRGRSFAWIAGAIVIIAAMAFGILASVIGRAPAGT